MLSAQEIGALCAPAYPRPFAGREKGRQDQVYIGARLEPCRGWRPDRGSLWGHPPPWPWFPIGPAGFTPGAATGGKKCLQARPVGRVSRCRTVLMAHAIECAWSSSRIQILRVSTSQYPSPRSGNSRSALQPQVSPAQSNAHVTQQVLGDLAVSLIFQIKNPTG
jgi:hypothetical protein